MAGYSGTPLIKKLGIKDRMRVLFLHAPDHYGALLADLPSGLDETATDGINFIHTFYYERADFEQELPNLMSQLARDGMIWISWPKKASKVLTTMSEDIIREVALPMGLVDVKVCAVDEIWSGLKLMIRKELR